LELEKINFQREMQSLAGQHFISLDVIFFSSFCLSFYKKLFFEWIIFLFGLIFRTCTSSLNLSLFFREAKQCLAPLWLSAERKLNTFAACRPQFARFGEGGGWRSAPQSTHQACVARIVMRKARIFWS